MQTKDIMTQPVVSVRPDDTIALSIQLMLSKSISGLPVIDTGGCLVGIITEGDFLRRSETKTQRKRPRWLEILLGPGRLAEEYVHTHGRKVAEVMTVGVSTVTEETPLDEVVTLMEKRRIKRVPVVRDDKVVGIVCRSNLLRALASFPAPNAQEVVSDHVIRQQLLLTLQKEEWAPIGAIDVVVHNGIVHIWGTIFEDRARQALVVAAENVPGVKGVRDHLTWVEIMSGITVPPEDEGDDEVRRAS